METGTVERAFEIAPSCATLDELRKRLKQEGHSQVDAHLAGPGLRAQLTKLLASETAQS